jgi:toxin ParE1/3/4
LTAVRLTRAATVDIAKAADWYESQSAGLGDKFLDRVTEAVDSIGGHPKAFRKVIRDVRRANLRQFPYALWFRLEDDAVVIACLHAKRDEVLAKERALGILQMPDPQ